MRNRARSRRRAVETLSERSAYEMIGNTVGSMRRTSYVTPAGSWVTTRAMAASTSSVDAIMSCPQPKSTEIWAAPREVSERTLSTPGTVRIASSTGRVTSSAIVSAGRSPASRSTTIRGNATCGNRPTGSAHAATAPAIASAIASRRKVLA